MKILIFNWRDIKNPKAGGAEVVTHECAKRWVKEGDHEVILFTAEFPGCRKTEEIDEVKVIRAGRQYSVHWHAFRRYRKTFKGKYDLVIDEINTIPFFTPLYAHEPVIGLIHQLCREIWWYETKFPLNALGYVSELLYLRLYRRVPMITVSESTKQDLLRLGFNEKSIHMIPEGIDFKPRNSGSEKESVPTLIYVGRLIKSKRVHHVIEAFKLVTQQVSNAQLWLVGSGDGTAYEGSLRRMVKTDGLNGRVKFWGRVSGDRKRALMGKAHALLAASVREGWGLIVIEANAMGTPAIGYNISGLRDSIRHEETGLLTSVNTPSALAEQVTSFLNDGNLQNKLCQNALAYARNFHWDRSAKAFMDVIEKVVGKKGV